MVFHAKALEFYSRCFENVSMIDEDMDLVVSQLNYITKRVSLSFKMRVPGTH